MWISFSVSLLVFGSSRAALMSRNHRIPGLFLCLVAAVGTSMVLSLMASVVLMGLPHAWDTATSWADIRLRTAWIAGVIIPAALAAYLLIRISGRPRRPKRDERDPHRRPPSKRGGLHR